LTSHCWKDWINTQKLTAILFLS